MGGRPISNFVDGDRGDVATRLSAGGLGGDRAVKMYM
jgi:hypothetical protein